MMNAKAKRSPAGRNLAGVAERIARIEQFEKWRIPICVDIKAVIGQAEWDRYWALCDAVIAEMQRCQEVANDIRRRIVETINRHSSQQIL